MEEFEIKFLEVDVPVLEKKLLQIGAKKVGDYEYNIVLFDYPDLRLDKDNSWVKLRTEGEKNTLSFKKRIGVKSKDGSIPDEGMQEIEIIVDNYEKTYELMKSLGFIVKREMGKRRIRYTKGKVVYDIDLWPQIPPFVEVEADSLENAKVAAVEAGFNPEKGLICSAGNIFIRYGYNPNDYISMTSKGFIKK
ncbi:MAG: CYTH domain-containing protein [Patescibacteria group bacterium]